MAVGGPASHRWAVFPLRPTLPPVRVVTTVAARRPRIFHEHAAPTSASTLQRMISGSGWVELTHADDRYVCPRCGVDLAGDSRS
jgi:hypothetical protein